MATVTLTKNVELVIEECISCGVVHAIPQALRDQYRKKGGYWCCPNGHSQGWDKRNCETEADKLRDQIAQLESAVSYKQEQVEVARRQVTSLKGEITKTKNRIAKGVCPCCHRQFQNLHRHMETKHPQFAEAESEK